MMNKQNIKSFPKAISHKLQLQKGFTLIEIIISIAVLTFGIISVYGAVALTNNVSLRFNGAYLAQEGLEIIRNFRDNNVISGGAWSSGLTSCSAGCQTDYKAQLVSYNGAFLGLNSDGFYSYDANSTPTKFQRKITITPADNDTLNVDVTVFWSYNGKSFSYQTNGYLYNWK